MRHALELTEREVRKRDARGSRSRPQHAVNIVRHITHLDRLHAMIVPKCMRHTQSAPSVAAPKLEQVSWTIEDRNRRMLRARDTMDRAFAQPLDVPVLAQVAHISPAHFSRQFRVTFGETPHRYLQRRRIERAMELLRETGSPVTEICLDVGFNSPGTFTRTFREIVGEPPSAYRARFVGDGAALRVPACWAMSWLRPAG